MQSTETASGDPQVNVDPLELAKFEGDWWDPNGDYRPLHDLNPERLAFVKQHASLDGARVLDVGCGGGILAEAMAAEGARVTGIDLSAEALNTATRHARAGGMNIAYRQISAEEYAQEHAAEFDLVTCLEMLEHVPRPDSIVSAIASLLTAEGKVVFSTINRTPKAFALAIVGAEYIAGLLPRGTHQYAKLIRPSELAGWCRAAGLEVGLIEGLHYNPINRKAWRNRDVAVNYLLAAEPQQGR